MKKILVIHHNDLDGFCAAAVIAKFFNFQKADIEFHSASYDDELPIDKLEVAQWLYIVDFSFSPKRMNEIFELVPAIRITWIDHHKTAMEYDYGVELEGVREIGKSGCELVWEFFYPSEIMPETVKLIGDYDCWRHEDKRSKPFYEASKNMLTVSPGNHAWQSFLDEDPSQRIVDGYLCLAYRDDYCEEMMKRHGFEITVNGLRCFMCNLLGFESGAFGVRTQHYDAVIGFIQSKDLYNYSIYSTKTDVDCADIAKKFGGGGHKGAAGFSSKRFITELITMEEK